MRLISEEFLYFVVKIRLIPNLVGTSWEKMLIDN